MSQQNFDLEFRKPDGSRDHKTVYLKPPSNVVRRKLQKLEQEYSLATVKISKRLQNDFPNIVEMQSGGADEDVKSIMKSQEDLNIDDFEKVLKINNQLSELETETVIKEIIEMIDYEETERKSSLRDYHKSQLNSEIGQVVDVTTDSDNIDKSNTTPEFNFWEEQDLDVLMTERQKFFRRSRIR